MVSHNLEPKERECYLSRSIHFIHGDEVIDRACNCSFDRARLDDPSLCDSDTQTDDTATDFMNSG